MAAWENPQGGEGVLGCRRAPEGDCGIAEPWVFGGVYESRGGTVTANIRSHHLRRSPRAYFSAGEVSYALPNHVGRGRPPRDNAAQPLVFERHDEVCVWQIRVSGQRRPR